MSVNRELRTVLLPTRLDDSGYLALKREGPETQTADAKLTQESPRPPAKLASIVLAAAELRLPRVLHSFCSSCHKTSTLPLRVLAEGHSEMAQQRARLVVVLRCGHNRDVHALQLFHLGVIDLRKN